MNNFKRINHCKFHHKSYLKPFLSYPPCIVCREYSSIIFNVKKCALYSIKYGNLLRYFFTSDQFHSRKKQHKSKLEPKILPQKFSLRMRFCSRLEQHWSASSNKILLCNWVLNEADTLESSSTRIHSCPMQGFLNTHLVGEMPILLKL